MIPPDNFSDDDGDVLHCSTYAVWWKKTDFKVTRSFFSNDATRWRCHSTQRFLAGCVVCGMFWGHDGTGAAQHDAPVSMKAAALLPRNDIKVDHFAGDKHGEAAAMDCAGYTCECRMWRFPW